MARYGQSFKDKAVARLLPPESAAVEVVAREVGVGVATLERWREDAQSRPARGRAWTAAARLEAVIVVAALDEAGGAITAGTKINFDSTEKRAVSGLAKKGLLLVQDGEVEVTALGAAWFRKALRARLAA